MKPTPERARPVYACRLRGFTAMESDIVRQVSPKPAKMAWRLNQGGDTDAALPPFGYQKHPITPLVNF